jgi:hypothetical protein
MEIEMVQSQKQIFTEQQEGIRLTFLPLISHTMTTKTTLQTFLASLA